MKFYMTFFLEENILGLMFVQKQNKSEYGQEMPQSPTTDHFHATKRKEHKNTGN